MNLKVWLIFKVGWGGGWGQGKKLVIIKVFVKTGSKINQTIAKLCN